MESPRFLSPKQHHINQNIFQGISNQSQSKDKSSIRDSCVFIHMIEALQQNVISFLVRFDITIVHHSNLYINERSHAAERERADNKFVETDYHIKIWNKKTFTIFG